MLPISYSAFLIGSLSLMGMPFLTGFYSKDLILEISSFNYNVSGLFSFWLASISVACTAGYSMRLLYYVFLNNVNVIVNVYFIKESSLFTLFVLCMLGFFSLVIGYCAKDLFVGIGADV